MKQNLFVWDTADLVMSWHTPCLPKWGQSIPSFLRGSLSLLNLKTVDLPSLLVCVPPPPLKITELSESP